MNYHGVDVDVDLNQRVRDISSRIVNEVMARMICIYCASTSYLLIDVVLTVLCRYKIENHPCFNVNIEDVPYP